MPVAHVIHVTEFKQFVRLNIRPWEICMISYKRPDAISGECIRVLYRPSKKKKLTQVKPAQQYACEADG